MSLDIVSKHRAPLYGFAILWVVVFHAIAIDHADFTFGHKSLEFFHSVVYTGNVGVDMFLLLSGISLYYSFHKNPDMIQFLKKRLIRVVPAVWLVYTLWWAWRYLILDFSLPGFLSRMTMMRFWMTGDGSIWYVSLILVLYFLYPFIYHFLFDEGHRPAVRCAVLMGFTYMLVVLFSIANPEMYANVEIAITRIPVFILGSFMGKYVYEKRKISKWWAIPIFAVAIGFLVVLYFDMFAEVEKYYERFFYLLGGLSLSYAIALICTAFDKVAEPAKRPLHRFLSFTGGFSLELYLSHIMLNQVMTSMPWYIEGNLVQYFAMAAIAFLLAWVVMKIIDFWKDHSRILNPKKPKAEVAN